MATNSRNGNDPGFGDNNNGFGLMQVDKRYHTIADTSNIDNIDQGTGILKNALTEEVEKKHPTWTPAWQLRGAVAAYNFGAKNVQTQAGIDGGSASSCSPCDGNYSWDTVNRAKWFAGRRGGTAPASVANSDFGGKQDCYGQVGCRFSFHLCAFGFYPCVTDQEWDYRVLRGGVLLCWWSSGI